MAAELLLPLILFAALMVGTPGPANMVLMAAGARFGLRRCLPFVGGVIGGKLALNIALAAGLGALLTRNESLTLALRYISAAYLLYLAWRIATTRLNAPNAPAAAAPGFVAGLVVHPLNPKAWAMLTAAYAQFTRPQEGDWLAQAATVCAVFFALQWVVHPAWCWFGERLAARWRGGGGGERQTMRLMAAATVGVVFWSLWRQAA